MMRRYRSSMFISINKILIFNYLKNHFDIWRILPWCNEANIIFTWFIRTHRNSTAYLVSGYRANGKIFADEKIRISGSTWGTMFHSLRLVINNGSPNSTEIFLDNKLFGTIQEHFVPRLKGGVFVLNEGEGVALFKNFQLRKLKKGIFMKTSLLMYYHPK